MALLNALQLYVIIVVINICGLDKTSNRKKHTKKPQQEMKIRFYKHRRM